MHIENKNKDRNETVEETEIIEGKAENKATDDTENSDKKENNELDTEVEINTS